MNGQRLHPADARTRGFIIDDSCYPWFAYQGERRAPDVWHHCYTDLESALLGYKGDGTISCYVDDVFTAARTKLVVPFTTYSEFFAFARAILGNQRPDVFTVTKSGRVELLI